MKTKSDRNFESRSHTTELHYIISELLFLTFHYTVEFLDATAILHPEQLTREFSNAFETYQLTGLIVRHLEESGRTIVRGLEAGQYGRSYRELFLALSPNTQALLKAEGINYEQQS